MVQLKVKVLLAAIWLVFSISGINFDLLAQEGQEERGYRGPIAKEDLLSRIENEEVVEGYVIKGHDLIEIMRETDHEIEVIDAIIEGGLLFKRLPTVKNKINIVNSEIGIVSKGRKSYSVDGEGTAFQDGISFDKSVFLGDVILRKADFSRNAIFGQVTFRGDVSFREAAFKKGAYFRHAMFGGESSFRGVTFGGEAYFRKAVFKGEAYFREAIFDNRAYFRYAIFSKLANFKDAEFRDILDLRFSKFKVFANFRNTNIRRLNFNNVRSPTISEGRIDFRKATISEAHFQDIIFEKDVDFSDVTFGDVDSSLAVVFRYITFENDVNFFRAKFHADTALDNLNFKKSANFTEASFQKERRFSLSYVNFHNLVIALKQMPKPTSWVSDPENSVRSFEETEAERTSKTVTTARLQPLSQVLKGLEVNFHSRNQLNDANEAYYHLKNAELIEEREGKALWQWLPRQMPWIVWGVTCGYGTRIYRVLTWCILFDLIFAIIYCMKGDLKRQPHPETKKEFIFKQRLLDFPEQYLTGSSNPGPRNRPMDSFISALRFSSVVLLKVGYRDTTISGKIAGIDYKYIVWIEWLLGLYLLASLAVTLSNAVPIINRLITGVF